VTLGAECSCVAAKVLNLFLALLLSSFGAESLSQTSSDETAEPNKLQEAVDRINRFCIYVKSHASYAFKRRLCRALHQRPATTPGSTASLACDQTTGSPGSRSHNRVTGSHAGPGHWRVMAETGRPATDRCVKASVSTWSATMTSTTRVRISTASSVTELTSYSSQLRCGLKKQAGYVVAFFHEH